MEHALNSPSTLERREICPGSAKLEPLFEEEKSDYADEGTMLHEATLVDPDFYIAALTDEQEILVGFCNEKMMEFLPNGCTEIIGGVEERHELIINGKVITYGYIDRYFINEEEKLISMFDLKFGYIQVTKAEHNLQILCYALMLHHKYPDYRIQVAIIQPRTFFFDVYMIKSFIRIESRVLAIILRTEQENMVLKFSESGCRYCKASNMCSEYRLHTHAIQSSSSKNEMITPEMWVDLYEASKVISKKCDNVKNTAMRLCLAGKLPGYEIKKSSGGYEVKNVNEFLNFLIYEGLVTEEQFLESVTASFPQLRDKARDTYQDKQLEGGNKITQKEATDHIIELCSDFITAKKDKSSLKKSEVES